MKTRAGCASIAGRRPHNEDSVLVADKLRLYAVADGMGGYEGGEVASRIAVETLARELGRIAADPDATWAHRGEPGRSIAENLLAVAIRAAHDQIRAERAGDLGHMGSTIAAVLMSGDRAVVGHVGDSRVYRVRGGIAEPLTRDHSVYEELRAAGGEPVPRHYAHLLTRGLGMDGDVRPDVMAVPLEPGDHLVVCSDGLVETLGDADIAALIAGQDPSAAASALVTLAFARGGRDNISALVVAVDQGEPPDQSSPASRGSSP